LANLYESGNTITLTCEFKDIYGNLIDPGIVSLIFYDSKYKQLSEVILNNDNRISLGNYTYDYHSDPAKEETVIYEWKGELSGRKILNRKKFRTKFML
jgi:hypothetical protein